MSSLPRRSRLEKLPQCQSAKKDGSRCTNPVCGAEALIQHGLEGHALASKACYFHISARLQPTERMNYKGGKGRAKPKPLEGIGDVYDYTDVIRAVAPALVATFDEGGPADGEPDWSARLSAAAVIVGCLPEYMRDTPDKVRELIERYLPVSVLEQSEFRKRAQPEVIFGAARNEFDRLRGRRHPTTGLYVRDEYPAWMIAPWEDKRAVLAARKPED